MSSKGEIRAKILVTGSTGYIGRFLTRRLLKNPVNEVYGFNRRPDPQLSSEHSLEGDILNVDWVELLKKVRPHQIFHTVGASAQSPFSNQLLVHGEGTRRLLQGLLDSGIGKQTRVIIAGSAAEYGLRDEAVDEMARCHPEGEYGIAKLTQSEIARTFVQRYDLPVTVARIFNVYGETERHLAIAAMAYQLARAEAVSPEPCELHVHNLRSWRDFIHIDDVVDALLALAAKPVSTFTLPVPSASMGMDGQIYNIASGQSTALSRVMDALLDATSLRGQALKNVTLRVHGAQREEISRADISKIRQHTGWIPKITLQEGLKRELEYWRQQVAFASAENHPSKPTIEAMSV